MKYFTIFLSTFGLFGIINDMKFPIFDKISLQGIIPVIAIDNADKAIPLADALLAGGLRVVEITFRTEAAAEAISRIVKARSEMVVGAGTVLTVETLKAAREAGATFAVAPGFNPRVVEAAGEFNFPFIPGVATPSEIEQGLSYGLELLKMFPAEQLGGVSYLNAIYAPYKHTGVKFMVTGGIKAEGAPAWLASPAVVAVGGSWLAKASDIQENRWEEIAARSRAASALR